MQAWELIAVCIVVLLFLAFISALLADRDERARRDGKMR
jgi:hypothetical protein